MIEGLPASDALTPADRYLELLSTCSQRACSRTAKPFDCAPKMDPLDILIRYRKVRRHRDFDLRQFVENHFWLPETYSTEYVSDPVCPSKSTLTAVAGADARAAGSYSLVFLLALPKPISFPADDSARPTTGIPISPCWGWRRAVVTIC
jgi:hypothetical protein